MSENRWKYTIDASMPFNIDNFMGILKSVMGDGMLKWTATPIYLPSYELTITHSSSFKSTFQRPFTNTSSSFSFCYSLLCQEINQDDSFHLEYRGPVIMKGKPTPMDCWFLTRATSAVANASGNGSLDSPLLQPTTPTVPQRMGLGMGMGMAGHASVSRTSSASGSGSATAAPPPAASAPSDA